MEEKKTIFNDISDIFARFGVIVSIFTLFSLLFGDYVGPYSSLFRLGSGGLSTATLSQLFLLAIIIVTARNFFLTDRWIKYMVMTRRNVLFFLSIMVSIAILIVLFDWFPIKDWKAWVGFFVSYTISMTISVFVTRLKEEAENKRMQAALDKYHQKEF